MTQLFYTNTTDFEKIVEAILKFVEKYPKTIRCKRDYKPVYNPIQGMLALSRFGYMVCEIFDNEKKLVNRILQFTTWNDNTVARDGSIYVSWGDEVQIEEDLISVFHREDDGSFHESILRIFPSDKQRLYTM